MPNNAMQPTAASELAVPSSLCSSAAADGKRWAGMRVLRINLGFFNGVSDSSVRRSLPSPPVWRLSPRTVDLHARW